MVVGMAQWPVCTPTGKVPGHFPFVANLIMGALTHGRPVGPPGEGARVEMGGKGEGGKWMNQGGNSSFCPASGV